MANTGSTGTSYPDTGLSAGTTRHYRVSAINSLGTGPASEPASATTAPSMNATVSIAAAAETVDEGAPAQFTLTLSAGAPAAGLAVSVLVTQEGSVLAAPADYASAVTVTFAEGETEQTLGVDTEDDAEFETLVDAPESAGRITATVQPGADYAVAADATARR